MFTLIIPYNAKKRPKRRIYPKFKEYKDIGYFELSIPSFSGNPDWSGLITDERLMLPKNLIAPKKIIHFGNDEWKTQLSFEILKGNLKREKCDCIVYDKSGVFSEKLIEILPIARVVSVFSDAIDVYEKLTDFSLSQFGCAPKVNSKAGLINGYCFSFDGTPFDSNEKFKIVSKHTISEEMIKIPPEYLGIGIKNLSRIAFSEALYRCFNKGQLCDYLRF